MESINNGIINLIYVLQNLDNIEGDIEVGVSGTLISYNNNIYIISIHNGYPIKKIIINDMTFTNFTICAWCDLIIIPYNIVNDIFVFKQFVKKQMEPEDKYFVKTCKLKYINNIFTNIGFIPSNPIIMYNCLRGIEDIEVGVPIYNDKNRLVGIVSRVFNNDIYCVPINYILRAMEKRDNTKLYSLNEDLETITKINNYKIICDKIYCTLHKIYVPIDTFIAIHGDNNAYFYATSDSNRIKKINVIESSSNLINNNLLLENNNIKISYGLITLLQILNEHDLLINISKKNINNIKWNGYDIIN